MDVFFCVTWPLLASFEIARNHLPRGSGNGITNKFYLFLADVHTNINMKPYLIWLMSIQIGIVWMFWKTAEVPYSHEPVALSLYYQHVRKLKRLS